MLPASRLARLVMIMQAIKHEIALQKPQVEKMEAGAELLDAAYTEHIRNCFGNDNQEAMAKEADLSQEYDDAMEQAEEEQEVLGLLESARDAINDVINTDEARLEE